MIEAGSAAVIVSGRGLRQDPRDGGDARYRPCSAADGLRAARLARPFRWHPLGGPRGARTDAPPPRGFLAPPRPKRDSPWLRPLASFSSLKRNAKWGPTGSTNRQAGRQPALPFATLRTRFKLEQPLSPHRTPRRAPPAGARALRSIPAPPSGELRGAYSRMLDRAPADGALRHSRARDCSGVPSGLCGPHAKGGVGWCPGRTCPRNMFAAFRFDELNDDCGRSHE